jgi:hypothetical protein
MGHKSHIGHIGQMLTKHIRPKDKPDFSDILFLLLIVKLGSVVH